MYEATKLAIRIAQDEASLAMDAYQDRTESEDDWYMLTHYELIAPVRITEFCGDCRCTEVVLPEELAGGRDCYRPTDAYRALMALDAGEG